MILPRHWRSIVLATIALGFFLMPNLLWGNLYIVGGDDSRLYYIFPFEYLKNFSFNVMSNNTLGGNMGYFPVSYSAPTVAVLALFKYLLPMWNTQLLAYGLIVSFGFVFFYLFLQQWLPSRTTFAFWSGIAASLAYILSPFITRTFFQHQLISIFLIMVLPACLTLFIAGVKRKNMGYIIASSLLYSFFSSTVFGFPWLLSVVFTLVPLCIYFFRRSGSYAWKALAIFIGVTIASNIYWIIHYIIPVLYQTGESLVSKTFQSHLVIKQNIDTPLSLSLFRESSALYKEQMHSETPWRAKTYHT